MATGDFTVLDQNVLSGTGARLYNVAAGTPIYAGEPVQRTLGNSTGNVVSPASTNTPVVGTSYYVGIAATNSTNTASAAGTVNVTPLDSSITYLVAPKVAATWDTQAEYDALVGARVLIDLTAGVYTALAADSANNGAVVQTLDIFKYPGKVAVAFRKGASDLN